MSASKLNTVSSLDANLDSDYVANISHDSDYILIDLAHRVRKSEKNYTEKRHRIP